MVISILVGYRDLVIVESRWVEVFFDLHHQDHDIDGFHGIVCTFSIKAGHCVDGCIIGPGDVFDVEREL